MSVNRILVRTTYMELLADAPIRRSDRKRPDYELRQAVTPSPERARFLYTAVGCRWNWTSRLGWTYAEWERYLSDERISTLILPRA